MAESPKISFRMMNPVLYERLRERAEGAGETSLNNAARAIVEGMGMVFGDERVVLVLPDGLAVHRI